MKKIFTLIAMALMAVSANAQTTTYAIQGDDENVGANKSISAVDGITVTFGDVEWTVGGSNKDAKEVAGISLTGKYATTGSNGNPVTFTTTKSGTLTIIFGGAIATNKKIFMELGETGITGKVLSTGVAQESGAAPSAEIAAWDGVVYTLEANKSYSFKATGTKWRFAGFKYEAGTAGINSVKATAENTAIYNLAGQQVDKNYKGVVIQNGKKMIQK